MSTSMQNPLPIPGVEYSESYIPVDDQVELFVMHWRPTESASEDTMILVPGLVSIVENWADFLSVVVTQRPVYYIESREKSSAKIAQKRLRPADFSIARLATDLISVCSALPINLERTIFAGSSLGATTIVQALKHQKLIARAAFLIGPNSEFQGPLLIKACLFLPSATYHIIKYVIIWYLQTFRVDAHKEPEQMGRYRKTLLPANPLRLKMISRSAIHYQIWSGLETVHVPVGIAYATTDTLHGEENIQRLNQTMTQASLIPCPSNKYMHTAELVADLDKFIRGLKEL